MTSTEVSETAQAEDWQRWNPICQTHGTYDIREPRCPKCHGPWFMRDELEAEETL